MNPTPVSLLERLRDPGDQSAWGRFVDLYTPLLCYWGRREALQEPDIADLIQDVFQILIRKLPDFTYDRGGSFRGWLHTILINQYRTGIRRRVESRLEGGDAIAAATDGDDFIEVEYREYLVGRALQIMKTDFQPATWRAFWEYVVCDRPAAEVAAEVGVSVRAVYLAKPRILRRLREELDGLWE